MPDSTSPSVLALVAANLVPLAGVLWFGWQIGDLLLLFWLESAVIGFYNLCKLLVLAGWKALPLCIFFTLHYGGFMAGHLLFIVSFAGSDLDISLAEPAALLAAIGVFWPALLALLLSHGFSFVDNFLRRGEYRHKTARRQMTEPYARIMVMHVSILLGAFMADIFGAPLPALLLLVLLKTAIDLGSHLRERRSAAAAAGGN